MDGAGHVQHGVQAAVVERGAGNCHGAGLLVAPRIPRCMPCHITEQGPPREHPVEPADQVGGACGCSRREKLQREKTLSIGNLVLKKIDQIDERFANLALLSLSLTH